MRILLVDDDAGVVQALDAVLKTLPGNTVRTATTGDEALAIATELGGVDILVTDVVMEPMDGFTLRDHVLSQYPATRVILISGYDLSDYPEQTAGYQLLAKPIEADALRTAIAKESFNIPAPAAPEPVATPEPEPEPAPAPAPVAVVEHTPEPTPAPIPEPAPVAEATPEPAAVAPAEPVAPAAVAAPEPVAPVIPEPAPAPVAVPVAAPTPVAAPKAIPAATPMPAATPVARPTVVAKAIPAPAGTPVAKTPTVTAVPAPKTPTVTSPAVPGGSGVRAVSAAPKAVPAGAQPAVTVKAAAVPRPSGVTPSPVAKPAAVPVAATPVVPAPAPSGATPGHSTVRVAATVKAQPIPAPSVPGAPTPVARPVSAVAPVPGTPVAKATSAPGVKTSAVPAAPRSGAVQTKAVNPTAAPKTAAPVTVTATAVPAPSAVSAPSAPAPFIGNGEDLSGTMLGAYQLHRKTSEGRWGGVYAGLQTSINRPVSLEVLDATKAADPVSQGRFVADARAKAGVQHPSILAVYEAGEADGRFFYAYEYVDGQSIADLKAASQRLDEPAALKVLRVAADGLAYFGTHHTPHTAPDASNIYLGADGEPRLGNIATQLADEQLASPQEIQALGRVMLSVLPAIQSLSPGLRELLKRMVQPGPQAMNSWGQVLQAIKAIEPKVVPTDAAKISAHDRAAVAAVELARQQQKRSLYMNMGSLGSLVLLVVLAVWFFLFRNKERIHEEQIHIPAGEFLFANGEKTNLPDFWIDKYEVTYGQYAKFVQELENRPTSEFDHPQQPRSKTALMHRPPNWAIYYGRAEVGGKARSIPIDLACPVMEVDFWDAYAYAKWKSKVTGREYDLPTEQEWEKAARGTKGFAYPWGDEPDPKKANSNADYNENPLAKSGQIDGYGFWNPVDKEKGDKSPYGVMGMAGNVREWTGTWDKVKKRPVVKGGSFMSSDVRVDQRADLDPSAISDAIGFRTVCRTPPAPTK